MNELRNYDKKLSSNLYISLSRKISSVKRTLTKKKKKTLQENQEEYIEHLHQIINTQRKRIKKLERDENNDEGRRKIIQKVGFLKENYKNLERLINDLAF